MFNSFLLNEDHAPCLEPHITLNSLCPLDGRYTAKTLSLRKWFSEQALIHHRVIVEIHWLLALSEAGIKELPPFSNSAQTFLLNLYQNFSVTDAKRIKEIEAHTNHDVKAIEYWLQEQIAKCPELNHSHNFIHFACTSEDINNTAYALMLDGARQQLIVPALLALHKATVNLAHQHANVAMLSRTHGQTASPTTLGKELANFAARLEKAIKRINKVAIYAKLNGAVGNYNAHLASFPNVDWPALTKNLIENKFKLNVNTYTIQIEPHDYMAELFDAVARANTILLDLNRDIWGYISLGYFKQKMRAGEVGSSTMPHKVNPIDFENAEGNLGLSNALLKHFSEKLPISRWQRDLSDSTVLRSIGVALGYGLLAYTSCQQGLNKLEVNTARISEDLNNAWEVLAEPIQTVMRRYGIANPYEQLKTLTRGKTITQALLHEFIDTLDISIDDKQRLLTLRPATYIGHAAKLASEIGSSA